MLETILLINLTFSIVGFFFILRMWREVKSRRDFYGENFGIPKGKDRSKPQAQPVYEPVQQQQQQVDMAQLATLLQQVQQPAAQPQQTSFSEGDLQMLLANSINAQNGGA